MKIYRGITEVLDLGFEPEGIERKELMVEHSISFRFELQTYIKLEKGDSITYNGKKFYLKEDYISSINKSTNGFVYDLKFYDIMERMKDIKLKYNAETDFKLTTTGSQFLDVVVSSFSGITKGSFPEGFKEIHFENLSVFDALNLIAEAYNTEWWLNGSILNISKCEFGEPVLLRHDIELDEISVSPSSETMITRLYAKGSTRNIPRGYSQDNRLKLATGYVDLIPDLPESKIIEGVHIFEDIYPRQTTSIVEVIQGSVGDTPIFTIRGNNTFEITQNDVIAGQPLKIAFNTGNLAGKEFELIIRGDNKFEIKYIQEGDLVIPNLTLKPEIGDEFFFFNFNAESVLPSLITQAENELLVAAQDYLDNLGSHLVYSCNTRSIYCEENEIDLEIGRVVTIQSPNIGSVSTRIRAYEKQLLNKYECNYKASDYSEYSRIKNIEKETGQKIDRYEIIDFANQVGSIGHTLSQWASDGYISPTEKIAIRQTKQRIFIEKQTVTEAANKYEINITSYNTAWTNYDAVLAKYSADSPENIPIENDFSLAEEEYKVEKVAIDNAITNAQKADIDSKQSIGDYLSSEIFYDLFDKVEISTGVWAIKAKYDFYSIGEVSAYGFGTGGSSGGGVDLLQAWTDYDSTKDNWAVKAGLLVPFYNDTRSRLTSLEGGAALSLSPVGTGNGIANITKSGTVLTVTKANFAELDVNGKILSSQLPSYVDDVLEYVNLAAFPTTGETGKIYIAQDSNKTYRWSGTAYVEISASLALGETSSTAYRGDRGKIAYDHSQTEHQAIINGTGFVKANGKTLIYDNNSYSLASHNHSGIYEPVLGNPTANGYLLSSTTDGARSWVAPYSLPTASASVLGGVKIGANVSIANGVISVHNPLTIGTANGLSLSTQVLSLALATTASNGALSSTDKAYIDLLKTFFEYDSTNNAIKALKPLYSIGEVAAYGLGTGGSSGGSYDRLDAWADYDSTKSGWVLSALLGNELNTRVGNLNTRVGNLESGSALTINTTGTGNAITSISKEGTVITATKGATFSLNGHTHDYLPLSGGTLTGPLTASAGIILPPGVPIKNQGNVPVLRIDATTVLIGALSFDPMKVAIVGNPVTIQQGFDEYIVYHTGNLLAATTSANGLMSSADKAKLDGIAAGANNYVHPSSHPISFITGLQSALDGKSDTGHTHNYLPLSGGTLTGDLSIRTGNTDKYITFDYNGNDTYNWRIGYLGTGSGDANYFTIQSSKSAGGVYFDALRLGLETLNAQFFGTVTAPTFIGALTGNASSATKLQTARTIAGVSFDGSANIAIPFANLASKPTTLAGYGITDAYTKAEVNSLASYVGGYNFSNGFLVKTNVARTENSMLVLHIKGNSYGGRVPINTLVQVYNYVSSDSIIQTGALNNGYKINEVKAFYYDNLVYFWVPQQTSFMTMTFQLLKAEGQVNRVVSVSNSAVPTTGVEKMVTITPRTAWFEDTLTNLSQLTDNIGVASHIANTSNPHNVTKAQVGLGNVDNTADSAKNVLSATKLTTARTINGTSFNGSANITTANWGTARTLTIGNTGKSVNGSANVSWSLSEIGAAPASHNHSASNITSGTLDVARGGTGASTLASGKVLVGNSTSAVLQPTNLHWDNTNNRLGVGTASPEGTLEVYKASGTGTDQFVKFRQKHDTGSQVYSLWIAPRRIDYVIEGAASGTDFEIGTVGQNGGSFNSGYGNINLLPHRNVGIGTSSPAYKLDVNGTGRFAGALTAAVSVTTPKVIFAAAGWSLEQVGTELQFKYNGAIKQRLLSDGTIVGIGEVTAFGSTT